MTSPKVSLASVPAIPAKATCIIYTRVSTEDQAKEEKVSLAVQERECRRFATVRGFTDPALWPPDHESGRSTARLERLVGWCEAHRQSGKARGLIIALRSDRWGRFVDDEHASDFFQRRLAKAGWDVDFALEPKSDNRMVRRVTQVLSEEQAAAESVEKARRAYEGMLGQAQQARWMGRPPYGYTRVAVGADGRRRRLEPGQHASDDEYVTLDVGALEATRAVKLLFRRAREGATCKSIAAELNAAHIPGPFTAYRNGGAPKWRACVVRAILQNPVYGGVYRWHRRHNVGKKDNGADLRDIRPKNEWVEQAGAFLALVEPATVAAVQRGFATRRGRRMSKAEYLLSGLARCGQCGSPLVGGGGRGANRHYKCSARDTDKTDRVCPTTRTLTVNRALLEGTVIAKVAEQVHALVASGALAKTLDDLLHTRGSERQARQELEQERATLEQKRNRLEDAVLDGTLSQARGKVKLGEIEAALSRVDRDLTELRLEPSRQELQTEKGELLKLAADFPARLAKAPPAVARDLLEQWVTEVVVHPSPKKGANLAVELGLRTLPAVGSHYAGVSPAHRAPGKPCWRADSPRSSPG